MHNWRRIEKAAGRLLGFCEPVHSYFCKQTIKIQKWCRRSKIKILEKGTKNETTTSVKPEGKRRLAVILPVGEKYQALSASPDDSESETKVAATGRDCCHVPFPLTRWGGVAEDGQHHSVLVGVFVSGFWSYLLVSWELWLESIDIKIAYVCVCMCVHEHTFSTDHILSVDRRSAQRAWCGVVMILPDFLGGFDMRGVNVWDVQCLSFCWEQMKLVKKWSGHVLIKVALSLSLSREWRSLQWKEEEVIKHAVGRLHKTVGGSRWKWTWIRSGKKKIH